MVFMRNSVVCMFLMDVYAGKQAINVALFQKGSNKGHLFDWFSRPISLECGSHTRQWNLLQSHIRQISRTKP
jgi:hypothetical protein